MNKTLLAIQQKMKSRKDCYNDFGDFLYRNVEKMLADLKPILNDMGCVITFVDDVIQLGERWYIKATVTLHTPDGDISTTAFAREQENKKGMDQSQITGSASTYARKYALCGLLAIDDGSADPDSMDNSEPTLKMITKVQVKTLTAIAKQKGSNVEDICTYFKVKKLEDMTEKDYGECMNMLVAKEDVNG